MNLQQRLLALQQRKLIDHEIHCVVLNITELLTQKWKVDVTTKQMSILLVHLAMALGRIKRGYQARPLDKDIYSEIESAVSFPKILQRHQEILNLIPFTIPMAEQTHFIANIYTLSLDQPCILGDC